MMVYKVSFAFCFMNFASRPDTPPPTIMAGVKFMRVAEIIVIVSYASSVKLKQKTYCNNF